MADRPGEPTHPVPPSADDAVAELIARYLDGVSPDAEVAVLNRRLAVEAGAREQFVRHARIHGILAERAVTERGTITADAVADGVGLPSLHDAIVQPAITFRNDPTFAEPAVDEGPAPLKLPVAQPPARRRWIGPAIASGLAAAVAVAVGVSVLSHGGTLSQPTGSIAQAQPEAPAFATLVASIHADVRRGEGPAVAAGEDLSAGVIQIRSGWARLQFGGGATVAVEGPARVRVRSASEMDVVAGRVTALVPPVAHGFAINGPNCRVVDLGTEFGIDVGDDGHTEVGVFRGAVMLFSGKGNASEPLREGGGRRFDAGSDAPVSANVDAGRYVRVGQLDRWLSAAASGATPVDRLRAAEEQLCRDPSLALYFSFTNPAVTAGVVPNRAVSTAGQFNLPVEAEHAPGWADGRLPGLACLDFDANQNQRLVLPKYPATQNGQLTCAAWVYCRERAPWASIAKNWGATVGSAFHFGLDGSEGALEVQLAGGAYDPAVKRPDAVILTEPVGNPFPVKRWVHVAFTTDGTTARLFRDGRCVASCKSRPIPTSLPVHSLAIGFKSDNNGVDAPGGTQVGYWDGQMESLALFHRALSPEEIGALYAAGQPTTPPSTR